MSEIAFNINGEPFEVPPTMTAWRVRKLKPKGAPEVVYGRDGLPLFLPMDAEIDDLRREAPVEGRYRLDPVDDHNRTVPNTQASYVCVHRIERALEPATPTVPPAAIQADTSAQLVNALLESQKQHTELARMFVSQFPVLVNALSGVVRSAGDAGLPARVPFVVPVVPEIKPAEPAGDDDDESDDVQAEDDDESEDDDQEDDELIEVAPEAELNWARFADKAMDKLSPVIEALLGSLGGRLTGQRGKRAASAEAAATEPGPAAPAANLGAHLAAIHTALTPEEAEQAQQLAEDMPMAEKLAYVNTIRGMSVPEAVAYVRAELAALRPSQAPGSAIDLDAHVAAIRAGLTLEESKAMQLMAEELPFELRHRYFDNLSAMSVPEAMAHVRRELAGLDRNFVPPRRAAEPRTASAPSAAPSTAVPSTAPVAEPAPRAPEMRRRDGRRGARPLRDVPQAPAPAVGAPSDAPTAPRGGLDMISSTMQAHTAAIQAALTAEEDAAMRTRFAALSPAERSAEVAAWLTVPVTQAIARIRAQLAAAADRARPARPDEVATGAEPPEAMPAVPVAAAHALASSTTAPLAPANPLSAARNEEQPAVITAPTATAGAEAAGAAVPAADTLAATAPVAEAAPGAEAAPVLYTDAHRHLAAIEGALTPEERFLVHAMIAQQSPDEREVWLDQLVSRSVADGAAILRDAVRELTTLAPGIEEQSDEGQELDEGEQPDDGQELDDGEQPGDGQELNEGEQSDDGQELDEGEPPDDGQDASRARSDAARPPSAALATPAALASAGLPTLDAAALAHFDAIQRALTFAERMRVHEIAAQRPASELRAWIVELAKLPVPDAVTRLRAALAAADRAERTPTQGGVS